MFDPFEYLVAAQQGRAAEDRLQAARWARSRTTSPATAACRTSGRRRAELLQAGARTRRSTPSSAAPATPAPGA
ncbi:MAG: hypothetical protein MZW92_05345 [Comamonadaceae bacterium]|nr:hypothetical protein [Comamonadaceae bacterium]